MNWLSKALLCCVLLDVSAIFLSDWKSKRFRAIRFPELFRRRFFGNLVVTPRDGAPPALRQELRAMKPDQRRRLFRCLNKLKWEVIPNSGGYSAFDTLVAFHRDKLSPNAHASPVFLLWHREYLNRLELLLRDCDRSLAMPYWDSALDAPLPDPSHSMLFTVNWLGPSWGTVNKGFMANWTVVPEDCQMLGKVVVRQCGNDGSLLMTLDKVAQFLEKPSLAAACVPEDLTFENHHGDFHAWIDGHMVSTTCSPNDICFWLHHSNIDRIYELFRSLHPGSDSPSAYPNGPLIRTGWRANDTMYPFFDKKNVDGLSGDYTRLFYNYEPSPSTIRCTEHSQCQSSVLWCDKLRGRCTAMVRPDGECTGLPNEACCCEDPGTTPECVGGGGGNVKKCVCKAAGWAPRCKSSGDCQPEQWCEEKGTGECRSKLRRNETCAGLPPDACSSSGCVHPASGACVVSSGRCGCVLPPCTASDDECRANATVWCNTERRQCERKKRIGDPCVGLPDNACARGSCGDDQMPSCSSGTCQCKDVVASP